jgi:hypothetical protein
MNSSTINTFSSCFFILSILCALLPFKCEFTNPHSITVRILNVRGFLGFFGVVNLVLMFATDLEFQDWLAGEKYSSPIPFLFFMAFLIIVLVAIWVAPKGLRIKSSDGFEWFSDGRTLSVHLDNDASYGVTKDSVKKCAAMLYDKMQASNMPLFIVTPLNIDGILREMRKEYGVNVRDKIRLPTCWLYLKSIAFKRSQKSNITKMQALKKSIMSRRVVISR